MTVILRPIANITTIQWHSKCFIRLDGFQAMGPYKVQAIAHSCCQTRRKDWVNRQNQTHKDIKQLGGSTDAFIWSGDSLALRCRGTINLVASASSSSLAASSSISGSWIFLTLEAAEDQRYGVPSGSYTWDKEVLPERCFTSIATALFTSFAWGLRVSAAKRKGDVNIGCVPCEASLNAYDSAGVTHMCSDSRAHVSPFLM